MVKGTNMDRILKVMSAVNEYFEKKNLQNLLLSKLLHIYGVGYLSAAIASTEGT